MTASIFSLVVMAFDRHFAVIHPLKRMIWFRRAKIIPPVIWIASCTLMVISPFSFMVRDSLGKCFYTDEHIPRVPFWTYLLLINYIMPPAIISCAKDMVPRDSWPTWIFQTPARWADSKEKSCSNAHYCCGGFCGLLVSHASASHEHCSDSWNNLAPHCYLLYLLAWSS